LNFFLLMLPMTNTDLLEHNTHKALYIIIMYNINLLIIWTSSDEYKLD